MKELQTLVDALERYLAAKSGTEAEWQASFNGLLKALSDAKRALAK